VLSHPCGNALFAVCQTANLSPTMTAIEYALNDHARYSSTSFAQTHIQETATRWRRAGVGGKLDGHVSAQF